MPRDLSHFYSFKTNGYMDIFGERQNIDSPEIVHQAKYRHAAAKAGTPGLGNRLLMNSAV
ncbi:MAG: hypothetical protein AB2637_20695 [Candidatus Thiodiazotropha sp.]